MLWQRFREQLKEYITFTRKERNGILVLFLLLALSQVAVIYTHYRVDSRTADFNSFNRQISEFRNSFSDTEEESKEYKAEKDITNVAYHNFDPNTADAAELLSFKLPERTVNSILNFRNKGGKFYDKEDMKKIYNLHAADYARLEPYININIEKNKIRYEEKVKNPPAPRIEKIVELNAAAREDLMTLPMIGEKRAEQIIKYRNKLGGFFTREQLKEVYSLPDSIYNVIENRVVADPLLIQPIDLNTLTDSTYHPYMKKNLVKLIVAYRDQHGKYTHIEEIRKMPLMNDSIYIKIGPYLSVGETY